MAGKITSMSKIKQVLIMHTQGMSNRDIAEEAGLNKFTVNEYMRKARLDPLGIEALNGRLVRNAERALRPEACQGQD